MADYVCEQCREEIDEMAEVCPHCGHEGGQARTTLAALLIIVGLLLTATMIGSIVGIPMVYIGYRIGKKGNNISPGIEQQSASED